MGSVHLARRTDDGLVCVIKQMRAEIANDATVSQRFLREAQISSLLAHPNIARLIDAWREDGALHLAMEYVPGPDLDTILKRSRSIGRPIPPELAVAVSLDVLGALHYAHECRDPTGAPLEIVHRDLTPRNVMVSFDGEVKLIDFGIARADLGSFRTSPGNLVGTPAYMSPEQALGQTIDKRSDVYSWAVVLFEMLTGRPVIPFHNLREILRAILTHPTPPPSLVDPMLPRALDVVLEPALRKDRKIRYESAEEFRAALVAASRERMPAPGQLERFLDELFPRERERHAERLRLASGVRAGPELIPTRTIPRDEPRLERAPERIFTPKTIASIGALIAALGILIFLGTQSPPDPPRSAPLPPPVIAVAVARAPDPAPEPAPAPPEAPILQPKTEPRKAAKARARVEQAAPIEAARSITLSWRDEVDPLIEQGRLEAALEALEKLLASDRWTPAGRRAAKRCIANLDHRFNREGFEHCVRSISRENGDADAVR
jgi:serine/threonine-protein kinase